MGVGLNPLAIFAKLEPGEQLFYVELLKPKNEYLVKAKTEEEARQIASCFGEILEINPCTLDINL